MAKLLYYFTLKLKVESKKTDSLPHKKGQCFFTIVRYVKAFILFRTSVDTTKYIEDIGNRWQ